MATTSKEAERLELDSDSQNASETQTTTTKTVLTQAQIERMENNRKRALEIRKSKQSQENPAKMFEKV